MSAPDLNSPCILSRDGSLDDEKLTLGETIAYVAGYLNISIEDARVRVMDAIANGELKTIVSLSSVGNH